MLLVSTLLFLSCMYFSVRSQFAASFTVEGMSQPGLASASPVATALPSGCTKTNDRSYVQKLSEYQSHTIGIHHPDYCSMLVENDEPGGRRGYYTVINDPCKWAAGRTALSYGTLSNMCKGLGRTWHWHEDADEWGWVEKGRFHTWVSSATGLPWEVAANVVGAEGVWYFPRGWGHAFLCLTPEEQGGCKVHLVFSAPLAAVTGAHNLDKTLAQASADSVAAALGISAEEFGVSRVQFANASADPRSGLFVSPMVGMVPPGTCEPECPQIRETKVLPAAVEGDVANVVFVSSGTSVKQIRTAQFPFATTMSQEQVDLTPGAIRPMYWVTNADGLLIVTKGEIVLTLQGGLAGFDEPHPLIAKEKMEYDLKGGDIVYLPIGKAITFKEKTNVRSAQAVTVFNSGNWHSAELRDQLKHVPEYIINMSLTHTAENRVNSFKARAASPQHGRPVTASTASEARCKCGNGKAKFWGPGGPHTALVPTAEIFNRKQPAHAQIEICFGPESTWRSAALECGAGLYTAAEQQMAGFLRVYQDITNGTMVTPITLHSAVLVVTANNPKKITSLADVVNRPDVRIVVNDGNFVGSLTSGTAVWEDVVGRLDSLQAIASVRSKIVFYAGGSGKARDQLVNGVADVWFSWFDWYVANKDKFSYVALEPEFAITRPLSIAVTSHTAHGASTAQKFVQFLATDKHANAAMEAGGWFKTGAHAATVQKAALSVRAHGVGTKLKSEGHNSMTLAGSIKAGIRSDL